MRLDPDYEYKYVTTEDLDILDNLVYPFYIYYEHPTCDKSLGVLMTMYVDESDCCFVIQQCPLNSYLICSSYIHYR